MSVAPGLPMPAAVGTQPGMQPVTIGGITFWTQEAPANFEIGGVKQNVVEIELNGGGKITQQLGSFAKPFSFRGKFLANRVASQIPLIRQLCTNGQSVSLTYGSEQWTVVVKDVQPIYKNQWYATYEITLVVVSQIGTGNGNQSPGQQQQINQQQQQVQNLNSQIQQSDPVGSPSFQPQIGQLMGDLQSFGSSGFTSSQSQTLVNDAQAAIGAVNAYLATQSPTSSQYASASQLVDVLTLMAKNIVGSQAKRVITQQGGDCYRIASKYYGDASQAFAIMAANNLPSPFLSNAVPTTLTLPEAA